MLHRFIAIGGLGAVGLFGCGAGGVTFAGKSQPPVVGAAEVGSGDRAPKGHGRLGRLTAECTPVVAAGGFDGVRASDLSCSGPFLLAALKERASNAGGAFLVEPRCGGGAKGSALKCTAEVWGPKDRASFVPPSVPPPAPNVDPRAPAAPGAPPLGAVGEAWRVRVDFWPAPGQAAPAAVDPADIAEIDFPGVGQIPLGDLQARCEEDCSVDSVRSALRAAAGRIGATSLVGVRCVSGDEAPSCVASASLLVSHDEPRAEAR